MAATSPLKFTKLVDGYMVTAEDTPETVVQARAEAEHAALLRTREAAGLTPEGLPAEIVDHSREGDRLPTEADVAQAIAQAIQEVKDDIADGVQPHDVASFSELHEHTDANEYGGLCDGERTHIDWLTGLTSDVDGSHPSNRMQDAVDAWLKETLADREAADDKAVTETIAHIKTEVAKLIDAADLDYTPSGLGDLPDEVLSMKACDDLFRAKGMAETDTNYHIVESVVDAWLQEGRPAS